MYLWWVCLYIGEGTSALVCNDGRAYVLGRVLVHLCVMMGVLMYWGGVLYNGISKHLKIRSPHFLRSHHVQEIKELEM